MIEGFEPAEGCEGDLITIRGSGFGNDPNDLCVVVMNGERSIPLQAMRVEDDTIVARLGAVFDGAQPGPLVVGRGGGAGSSSGSYRLQEVGSGQKIVR